MAISEGPRLPWQTKEIAWFSQQKAVRAATLQRLAQAGTRYLVREVRVGYPGYLSPLKELQVRAVLEHTLGEHALLHDNGIRVPDIDWHITRDTNNFTRTLARVGIIDGCSMDVSTHMDVRPLTNLALACAEQSFSNITAYYSAHRPGRRLQGIQTLDQYMMGHPKDGSNSDKDVAALTPALYLIDIEPLYG